MLTPAQRTDLWVDFSAFESGQQIELLSSDTFIESGSMMGNRMENQFGSDLDLDPSVAATFVVIDSDPSPGSLPASLGTPPTSGVADAVNPDSPKQMTLSTRRASHWINNRQWEGREATDIETVSANIIELREFINQSPMAHGLSDTVLVWPGQRTQIAVPFGDHRGHFPYHCHILEHEDSGMMRNFRVI